MGHLHVAGKFVKKSCKNIYTRKCNKHSVDGKIGQD